MHAVNFHSCPERVCLCCADVSAHFTVFLFPHKQLERLRSCMYNGQCCSLAYVLLLLLLCIKVYKTTAIKMGFVRVAALGYLSREAIAFWRFFVRDCYT